MYLASQPLARINAIDRKKPVIEGTCTSGAKMRALVRLASLAGRPAGLAAFGSCGNANRQRIYSCPTNSLIVLTSTMFIPKRPDPVAARKELISNLGYFTAAVVIIRASTYVLDLLQQRD